MMDAQVRTKLLEINQTFYDQYADSFSVTRHQVQPGVRRVSQRIPPDAAVLDVGCGNGTLARQLAALGFQGDYLGIDLSEGLLADARRLTQAQNAGTFTFNQADLADPDWPASLPQKAFDWLLSFAVFHHLPGKQLRQQTAAAFRVLIAPGGRAAISVWQWQHSARLRKRVLPWSAIGISPKDLDPGDVLLDWRAGKTPGLRYVHTFTEDSLTDLARQAGFSVGEQFYADGKTGDLALYQVWIPEEESKQPAA